jgi:molybdopterin molybdotransferase
MVEEAGGIVAGTPTVSDDEGAVEEALRAALRSDVVVTVGGVSMGARDPVRPALARAGVELEFWRVAMRPGGPTAFGVGADGRPVFALPGNPVSAHVTFELFVRPALRRMAGHRACFRRPMGARLAQAVDPIPGKATYLRCRIEPDGEGWRAAPAGPQGSGVLSTLARADGLALLPAEAGRLEAGAWVEVWPLGDGPFQREDP